MLFFWLLKSWAVSWVLFFFIHTDFLNECTGGFIERPYLDLSDCFLVVSYFASLTLCISCDIEIGSKDLIRLRINAFQKEYFLSDLVYFILWNMTAIVSLCDAAFDNLIKVETIVSSLDVKCNKRLPAFSSTVHSLIIREVNFSYLIRSW
jgi:hypothetical protein